MILKPIVCGDLLSTAPFPGNRTIGISGRREVLRRASVAYEKVVEYAWAYRNSARTMWEGIQKLDSVCRTVARDARRYRLRALRLLSLGKAWRHKSRQQSALEAKYQEKIAELNADIDSLHNTIAHLRGEYQ